MNTRGQRLIWNMWSRGSRPTSKPLTATRAEIARLAVLRVLDDLVAAAVVEVSVTPPGAAWPARQRLAAARQLRAAIKDDFLTDTNERVAELWRLLNPEERPI